MSALLWVWLGGSVVMTITLVDLRRRNDLVVPRRSRTTFAIFCAVLCLGWPLLVGVAIVDHAVRRMGWLTDPECAAKASGATEQEDAPALCPCGERPATLAGYCDECRADGAGAA